MTRRTIRRRTISRRTISASELGAYLYCKRAWWYRKIGASSQNQAELAAGSDLHARHGRSAVQLGCVRFAAYALLLIALVIIAVQLTQGLL